MELRLKIEDVFNNILSKNQLLLEKGQQKCCNCDFEAVVSYIPIPIKKTRDQIFCKGWSCSYRCLISFLKNQRNDGIMEYNYSLNIIWGLMPFLITNWNDES